MPSQAQIEANRANAKKSTGPRTQQGKAASSRNATTHGLTAASFIVLPEDAAEFEELRQSLAEQCEIDPGFDEVVFRQLIHHAWTLRRIEKAELALMHHCPGRDPLTLGLPGDSESDLAVARQYDRLQRYRTTAENGFRRACNQLIQFARIQAAAEDARRIAEYRRRELVEEARIQALLRQPVPGWEHLTTQRNEANSRPQTPVTGPPNAARQTA